MRNHIVRQQVTVALAVFTLAAGVFPVAAAADTALELAGIRQGLSSRLDSLELRKQEFKRNARPIDELDRQCESIRDSLTLVRLEIEKTGPAVRQVAPSPQTGVQIGGYMIPQRFIPRNPFDWVIAAVILIAVIAALVLALGLLIALVKRAAGRRGGHVKARSLEARQQAAADDFRRKRFGPQPPQQDTAPDERTAEELRRVVGGDETAARTGQARDEQPHSQDEIRQAVLKAAREGASAQEICRRFHLSTDHVALLLRVARKDDPSRA